MCSRFGLFRATADSFFCMLCKTAQWSCCVLRRSTTTSPIYAVVVALRKAERGGGEGGGRCAGRKFLRRQGCLNEPLRGLGQYVCQAEPAPPVSFYLYLAKALSAQLSSNSGIMHASLGEKSLKRHLATLKSMLGCRVFVLCTCLSVM